MTPRFFHLALLVALVLLVVNGLIVLRGMTEPTTSTAKTATASLSK
ncbi:hypothetical protein HY624_01700 [Candidatus Uhrbacteria bacterium]|nr:hypothetical protein [Candidatus Uhrbacteria bacterium]